MGVTIDVTGKIWVANLSGGPTGVGSVTEYSSTGVQNPKRTITTGIDYPYAIATDGIGEIWVEINFNAVTVYPDVGNIPASPIRTFPAGNPVTGLAAHYMWMAFGGNMSTTQGQIGNLLSDSYPVAEAISSGAYSLAWDAAGNLYCGTIRDALNVTSAKTGGTSQLVAVGYFPWGIAVDSVRARVYVSDANHNQINGYSTSAGALLPTIQ